MNKDQVIKAKHNTPSGETVEFNLVATALKRQKNGEPAKYYPFFAESEQTWDNYIRIFGEEMLQEYAKDAISREFQLLYFQRSPTGEQVPVVKDGIVAKVKNADGVEVTVTQKDETPNLDRFLGFIEDPNLSAREITPEYCMRKAINIQTGVDKKWAGKSEAEKGAEAFKWMTKAQELMAAMLSKSAEAKSE
jgi:hypothetical protein